MKLALVQNDTIYATYQTNGTYENVKFFSTLLKQKMDAMIAAGHTSRGLCIICL